MDMSSRLRFISKSKPDNTSEITADAVSTDLIVNVVTVEAPRIMQRIEVSMRKDGMELLQFIGGRRGQSRRNDKHLVDRFGALRARRSYFRLQRPAMELNSARPASEDLIFAVTSLRERAEATLQVMSNGAFGVKKAWMGPSVNGVSDAGI